MKGELQVDIKLVRPYFRLRSILYRHGSTLDLLIQWLIKKFAKYVMILTDVSLIIYKHHGFIIEVNEKMYILDNM